MYLYPVAVDLFSPSDIESRCVYGQYQAQWKHCFKQKLFHSLTIINAIQVFSTTL